MQDPMETDAMNDRGGGEMFYNFYLNNSLSHKSVSHHIHCKRFLPILVKWNLHYIKNIILQPLPYPTPTTNFS